jgi:hypothetical protein
VLAVLFDRGGDSVGPSVKKRGEFSPFVDLDAFREVFALAYVHIQHAIDQQVVDLGNAAGVFDPQVVEDGPVEGGAEMELDLVRGFPLALSTRLNIEDFSLNLAPRFRGEAGTIQQGFEFLDVRGSVVHAFDNHVISSRPYFKRRELASPLDASAAGPLQLESHRSTR